jgi:phage-related tail protein
MAIQLNDDVKVPVRIQVNKAGMAEKNAEFLAVNRKLDEVRAEKAAASAEFGERIKALNLQRTSLMDVLAEGFETVQVDAYERVNEQRMEIETVRRDTGKVVEELTRPMSAEERQLGLDDVKPRGKGRRRKTEEAAEDAAE